MTYEKSTVSASTRSKRYKKTTVDDEPTDINGVLYFTLTQFAHRVGAWPSRISQRVRSQREDLKIPHIMIGGRPFIRADYVVEYKHVTSKSKSEADDAV